MKRAYRQIVGLAAAAHLSYAVLFGLLGPLSLSLYNAGSTLFYGAMLLVVERGRYRLAVTCVHLEVCLFAAVSTLVLGWGSGFALYLVAMLSVTYFRPFRHKGVVYLFAALEILLFLALRCAAPAGIAVPVLRGRGELWLYLYNACACFTVILFAAISAKVSAAVSRQELRAENRSLEALANFDDLTGLLSRRAFLARVEDGGGPAAVALGDVDNFKAVNDTWGHPCGDAVLAELAQLMRRQLGDGVEICRWGGEEFIFLFRGLVQSEVMARLQGLCAAVSEHPFRWGEARLHITLTVGFSTGAEGLTAREMILLADRQMYRGKAAGKNRVVAPERP